MANAASAQAVDISKERLREFLETEKLGHGHGNGSVTATKSMGMRNLDARGKAVGEDGEEEEI